MYLFWEKKLLSSIVWVILSVLVFLFPKKWVLIILVFGKLYRRLEIAMLFLQNTYFFYQGFLSQAHTIHRAEREGWRQSFIPLYHFYLLTDILHLRWLLRIFNRNACVYQTAIRCDLPPYRITVWLNDWWCNVCLFTWLLDKLILGFCYSDLTWEIDGFELPLTFALVLHPNRLIKYASHPLFCSWSSFILPKVLYVYIMLKSAAILFCQLNFFQRISEHQPAWSRAYQRSYRFY